MKNIDDLLRDHPFSDGLADDIVELIAACARNVVFEANAYLFREARAADSFYLIRHGTVALEMFAPGSGPFTFLTVKGGEILGADWLLPPYRCSFDARAVELTRAIVFDGDCVRGKCEADHHVGYELMKRFIPPLVEALRTARLQGLDLLDERKP